MPSLKSLLDGIKPIIENIIAWTKDNPELTKTIVLIAGAIGGLMVVLGPLLIMLPGLVVAFGLLTGPIGLVILAITALIAAGVLLISHWEDIKATAQLFADKLGETWGRIQNDVGLLVGSVGDFFGQLPGRISGALGGVIDTVIQWAKDLAIQAALAALGFWEGFKSMFFGSPKSKVALAVEQMTVDVTKTMVDFTKKARFLGFDLGQGLTQGAKRGLSGSADTFKKAAEEARRALYKVMETPFFYYSEATGFIIKAPPEPTLPSWYYPPEPMGYPFTTNIPPREMSFAQSVNVNIQRASFRNREDIDYFADQIGLRVKQRGRF